MNGSVICEQPQPPLPELEQLRNTRNLVQLSELARRQLSYRNTGESSVIHVFMEMEATILGNLIRILFIQSCATHTIRTLSSPTCSKAQVLTYLGIIRCVREGGRCGSCLASWPSTSRSNAPASSSPRNSSATPAPPRSDANIHAAIYVRNMRHVCCVQRNP